MLHAHSSEEGMILENLTEAIYLCRCKISNAYQSGINLRGGDSGFGHLSILPNLADFGHPSPKIGQNHEKKMFFDRKGPFFKIFGAFGAEN